ncbi:hypothetical protein D0862_15331, partial [Hortaea werneckii]
MVIKAQVLAGGRGKGHFDNGFKGGVRIVYSPREASILADQMIGHKLITKQTGERGRICNSVLIVERKFARREFYLAVLMDRATQGPVIVASSQGGMDIETVAKEQPEAIITTKVDIHKGVTDEMAHEIASKLGFSEQCVPQAQDTIQKLYKIFMEKDATQIEINPMSETSDHQVLCMDAKLNFDDTADVKEVSRLAAVELDDVHGGHSKTSAVDQAANVAVQLDEVETRLGSLHLVCVLLRDVTPAEDLLLTEVGVVVEVKLGVHAEHLVVRGFRH